MPLSAEATAKSFSISAESGCSFTDSRMGSRLEGPAAGAAVVPRAVVAAVCVEPAVAEPDVAADAAVSAGAELSADDRGSVTGLWLPGSALSAGAGGVHAASRVPSRQAIQNKAAAFVRLLRRPDLK